MSAALLVLIIRSVSFENPRTPPERSIKAIKLPKREQTRNTQILSSDEITEYSESTNNENESRILPPPIPKMRNPAITPYSMDWNVFFVMSAVTMTTATGTKQMIP